MRKIKHSSVSATRPARSTSGTYGWFKEKDSGTNTPGTQVTADFLNDLQDEITTVITDATGGNAALSDSTNQLLTAIKKIVDDKLAAYVTPVTTTINNFVKTANNSVKVLTYFDSATVTNGSAYTWPVQTIALSSIPSGATAALVRIKVNLNDGGNLYQSTFVRKNSSESWGEPKVINDPIQYRYDSDPALTPITERHTQAEAEDTVCIPVLFDTTTGTFEIKSVCNEGLVTAGGGWTTDTRQLSIEVWQEGFFVPTTVLTGV